MNWLFKITEKVSVPFAILGIVVYFVSDYCIPLYFCAGWLILHSILNCIYGGQNNLVTEIATYFVGAVIALIFKLDFWPCIAVSYCFAEILFAIPAFIWLAKYFFGGRKN